jgi:hypothetical protein
LYEEGRESVRETASSSNSRTLWTKEDQRKFDQAAEDYGGNLLKQTQEKDAAHLTRRCLNHLCKRARAALKTAALVDTQYDINIINMII